MRWSGRGIDEGGLGEVLAEGMERYIRRGVCERYIQRGFRESLMLDWEKKRIS